jgi:hypothetical protein
MAISRHTSGDVFFGQFQVRIGELLLARGLINEDQLARALANKASDERLGETLIRLRIVFENDLARSLASQCGLDYVDLVTAGADRACAHLLAERVARDLDIIPVRNTAEGRVVVAIADPLETDLAFIEKTLGAPIEPKVAELSAIRRLHDTAWPPQPQSAEGPPAPGRRETPPFRVRIADPEQAPELCDYLRRLGSDAGLESDHIVTVRAGTMASGSPAAERSDLEAYLRAWTALKPSAARLE